jgi:HAD superfamily hydrolase (TIGR01509 family)
MSTPSLLLFDLGGVLIENATFTRLNRLLAAPLDSATLKARWLASLAVRQFELGASSADEFAAAFIAEWEIGLVADVFLKEFHAWPSGFYPGARDLLGLLRQRYRIGCLSNCNVLHWEKFSGFKDEFDIALSSHRLGAIKPDDAAFILALEACDADPASVYFFDDSAGNVDTARRLGMRAFHVDGIAPLLTVLRAEKLLPC